MSPRFRSAAAAILLSAGILTAPVPASAAARTMSTLDGTAHRAPAEVTAWYVDEATGRVVVEATSRPAAAAFVTAGGLPASSVHIVQVTERPALRFDVRGGDRFSTGGGTGFRCMIGFSVVGGYVTAGHCANVGVGSVTFGFNGVQQGAFEIVAFPGSDFGFVRVNANWTPRPVVNRGDGGTVTVTGSVEAPVGAAVCRAGSTTGWRCGVVTAKNATVNFAGSGVVTGLTRTNVCAEAGDSGGPWLAGGQAQGMTAGGTGNCTTGGTTYFQPINRMLTRFGLRLVTG
jgi:streptogrisin C